MKKPVAKKVTAKKATHTTRKTTAKRKTKISHASAVLRAKKAAATRKKRKATLGGDCTWDAFGVARPWYRRGPQRIAAVARYAGYIPGAARKHGVVGFYLTFGGVTGYHAAPVLDAQPDAVIVDLWGAPYVIPRDEVIESYVPR